MGGETQIEYANDLDDLSALGRYHLGHTPAGRRMLGRAIGVLAVLLFVINVVTDDFPLTAPYLVAQAVMVGLGSLVAYFALRLLAGPLTKAAYRHGKNKGALGGHVLTITDKGLRDDSGAGTMTVSFDSIEHVGENDRYLFVFLNSVNGHVVPKRSVVRGDVDAFTSELKRRIAGGET